MSRLQRLGLCLIVLGGALASLGSIAHRNEVVSDFWAGFLLGFAVIAVAIGAGVAIREQRALQKSGQ